MNDLGPYYVPLVPKEPHVRCEKSRECFLHNGHRDGCERWGDVIVIPAGREQEDP